MMESLQTKETVQTVGSRSFKAGDVVLCCEPLVWALERSAYKTRCVFCLQRSQDLRSCSGCKLHRYCSKVCQTADWKMEHKLECALLKTATGGSMEATGGPSGSSMQYFLKTPRELIVKLANKLKLNPMSDIPGIGRKSARELWHMLPSHPRLGLVETTMEIAANPNRPMDIALTDVVEYYSNVDHNAVPILDTVNDPAPIGIAVYPLASPRLMTPVCWDKNVLCSFRGRRLIIHAMEDIPNYTGLKDLRYNNMPEPYHLTRAERRVLFENLHGYPCNCRKCTPEYEADINPLKCITVGCANRIPSDIRALQPCIECGALNKERLKEYRHFMAQYEAIKARFPEGFCSAMHLLVDLCKKLDAVGIVQPGAHLRYMCGWELPQILYKENRFEEGWKMTQELIVFMRDVYPKYDYFRAMRLSLAGVSSAACLKQLVEEQIGRLSAKNRQKLKSMSDQACAVISDYCREASDILRRLYGENSKETIKDNSMIALAHAIVRDIEKAFRDRK
ncbi:uncharacterized protein LOC129598807 [Paramacrobiotus metropolitanus]|uniref:uncharacterized protein LOC129598807 n=1 Tax=Paramacrobiotus metropolitanus TaxID=2943436 RepID=UPI002445DCF4|nr:uncharacterized protein LOC129598807 [Paramacrobiotus metropolitanus]